MGLLTLWACRPDEGQGLDLGIGTTHSFSRPLSQMPMMKPKRLKITEKAIIHND